MSVLEQLGLDVDKSIDLPTGGDFEPSGLIGPLMSAMVYTMTSQESIVQWNQAKGDGERLPFPVAIEEMGDWGFRYFFREYESAVKAADAIGGRGEGNRAYAPELVWRMEMMRDEVINWSSDDAKAKWPEIITDSRITVKTLRSKKYRLLYHQIALPAAVAAMAPLLGVEGAGFDLSELLDRNTVFDDAFYELYYGNPDAGKEDKEEFERYVKELVLNGVEEREAIIQARNSGIFRIPFDYSVSWERRARLWKAFGEDNAYAYKPMTDEAKGQYTVTSKALSDAIQISTAEWTKPIWCRVLRCLDPRVDATWENDEGQTRRRTLTVIASVYPNEAAARAAAEEYGAGAEGGTVAPKPEMPDRWVKLGITEDKWIEQVQSNAGRPVAELAHELQVEGALIQAWRDYLG